MGRLGKTARTGNFMNGYTRKYTHGDIWLEILDVHEYELIKMTAIKYYRQLVIWYLPQFGDQVRSAWEKLVMQWRYLNNNKQVLPSWALTSLFFDPLWSPPDCSNLFLPVLGVSCCIRTAAWEVYKVGIWKRGLAYCKKVQGDHSACSKPFVDLDLKVAFKH